MRCNDPKLIIVCGLPGSGKTTLAKELEKKLGAVRLCPDDWMDTLLINLYDEEKRAKIEGLQWELGQSLLTKRLIVIIEWGTWGRVERDTLREKARELNSSAELYFLSASTEVLFDRIQRRGKENPPIRREQVAQWMTIFQAPTPEEMALFDHADYASPATASVPVHRRIR